MTVEVGRTVRGEYHTDSYIETNERKTCKIYHTMPI